MDNKFHLAVATYVESLVEDYHKWCDTAFGTGQRPTRDNYKIEIEFGRKYAKLIHVSGGPGGRSSRSVHSFIVLKDTKPSKSNPVAFKTGDILKAATFLQPATNFSRGNIFTPPTYAGRATWTGVQ